MNTKPRPFGNINWIGLYTFTSREIARTFRAWIQNLGAPWSAALLYILIFGHVIGQSIGKIQGVPYIEFVLPGIVMMNMMASAFSHAVFSVYFMKWIRSIDELLIAPFSYFEMIIGFVLGAVSRAVIVGIGIYLMAIYFTGATIEHFWMMLGYAFFISLIFSFAGILVALGAKTFEQLSLPTIFIITPLTFLGGVFNSVEMMSPSLKWIVYINPFFYFVDGFRYSMIGIREANEFVGYAIILGLTLSLGYLTWYLFKIGWRIRE